MKPYLERVPASPDASWSMLNRRLDDGIPFQWHHHPELELTLTLNSRGQRFIGDHVGSFDGIDLVLVGSNLPHTWSSSEKLDPALPHVALVVWFRQEWIEAITRASVELGTVASLVARAGTGLRFSSVSALALVDDFKRLFELPAPRRLLAMLAILSRLAEDGDAEPLSSEALVPMERDAGGERIDRVLTHIHQSYAREIRLEELAGIAALSVSGTHRLFRRHMRATISDYIIRLRIGDACARLSGTSQPIQHIAGAVGYGSLANFNRHFRRLRGMSPRDYRARFRLR
ncbi:MAG TPA: AraC family transcriptional regulator [Mesorhizobium sp.]|jgi:AraC-like DNA-binding protein|uniref:AraC family transcriptional regulator n=1 Tax=Mesorhizobium sp. TaxID=1871066 RepID=UPI002DDD5E54|nr:AraC family transcriptional regulator [Mesorhizobium sp.]HEV2506320.1 AraC family transcriptional regulator [Mesorhizobium sp.]